MEEHAENESKRVLEEAKAYGKTNVANKMKSGSGTILVKGKLLR